MSLEKSVIERYKAGAEIKQESLCCPVTYNPAYLEVIPDEILQKDYGCGDPSQYVKEGDVVLDLGSGGGKICYIASQIVGAQGKVIGVDFNPTMLALAEKYRKQVGDEIGWHNVDFLRGRIQDLKTDTNWLDQVLKNHPIHDRNQYEEFQKQIESQQTTHPLVKSDSIDIIISNCVLNLVKKDDRKNMFSEMYRVLKKGARVAISDIVSDEHVPQELQNDPELWSGCISGAFQEEEFLAAFGEAGFYGMFIDKREEKPWRVVKGIEFRSVTVTAYKGKEGPCFERHQGVIYKGPWKLVEDDDGHVYERGARSSVCDKTFKILTKEPYKNDFIPVEPYREIPLAEAKPYDCHKNGRRDPRVTKGLDYNKTTESEDSCCSGSC
ncbi:methyltransferase domain-containing protein [PVC group bacterium]|nr:methyltransferase domain-containing protein [PVC group bacterium]